MLNIYVKENDYNNPLLELKSGLGKVCKFVKSENGGLVLFVGGIGYYLSSMSGAGITAFLASIGFGAMWVGIILLGLGFKYLPKLWASFWSLFS